jgi:hypothetical protein
MRPPNFGIQYMIRNLFLIRIRGMRRPGHVPRMREIIFVQNFDPEERIPLARLKHLYEDNAMMDLKGKVCEPDSCRLRQVRTCNKTMFFSRQHTTVVL